MWFPPTHFVNRSISRKTMRKFFSLREIVGLSDSSGFAFAAPRYFSWLCLAVKAAALRAVS